MGHELASRLGMVLFGRVADVHLCYCAKRRPLVVANARHSPSCGCALRLDRTPFDALLGHARKTLSL